jgi:hypothetical protein
LSASSQPVPFNWQQVDQRLSSILQSKVSEEIRKLIDDDVGHIRFQNIHNGNDMTIPSERLQMHRLRTDEWTARLYEGYCEIWQTQRKNLSPAFLRGIAQNVVSVVCSARVGAVTDEFVREQHRTGRDANWLKPALEAFKRDMQLLAHKWNQAAELDARTVQYMLESNPESSRIRIAAWEVITARARTRTLDAGIVSIEARIKMAESSLNGMLMAETPAYRRASVEQSVSRLKEERKELRSSLDDWQVRLKIALRDAAGIEAPGSSASNAVTPDAMENQVGRPRSKKAKRTGGRHQSKFPQVAPYRSEWKRATKGLLIDDPKMSVLQICRELDNNATKMPKKWIVGENRSFETAYKDQNVTQRIHTAISKIRSDLSKAGVTR